MSEKTPGFLGMVFIGSGIDIFIGYWNGFHWHMYLKRNHSRT